MIANATVQTTTALRATPQKVTTAISFGPFLGRSGSGLSLVAHVRCGSERERVEALSSLSLEEELNLAGEGLTTDAMAARLRGMSDQACRTVTK